MPINRTRPPAALINAVISHVLSPYFRVITEIYADNPPDYFHSFKADIKHDTGSENFYHRIEYSSLRSDKPFVVGDIRFDHDVCVILPGVRAEVMFLDNHYVDEVRDGRFETKIVNCIKGAVVDIPNLRVKGPIICMHDTGDIKLAQRFERRHPDRLLIIRQSRVKKPVDDFLVRSVIA